MNDAKYIGLDVHQETISVAVLDATGNLVMEAILETKTETTSYKPRVSDSTMVDIYNHAACLRQITKASSATPNESTDNKNPKSLATHRRWLKQFAAPVHSFP
jgi:hypothetical protein